MKKFGVFACFLFVLILLGFISNVSAAAQLSEESKFLRDVYYWVAGKVNSVYDWWKTPSEQKEQSVTKFSEDVPDWVKNLSDVPILGFVLLVIFGGNTLDYYLLKLLFFLLLFFLIYVALSYVNFPPSFPAKISIALVLPLISLFAVNQDTMMNFLFTYRAIGAIFVIFFPIVILSFLTYFIVMIGGNYFGIFIQRIIWLIYGGYLFLKGLASMISVFGLNFVFSLPVIKYLSFIKDFIIEWDLLPKFAGVDGVYATLYFLIGAGILYLFVYKNDVLKAWLARQQMKADIRASGENLEKGYRLLGGIGADMENENKSK